MFTKISLQQYLKMGGDLSKIDLSKTFSEYQDKNQMEKIISFEDRGDVNEKSNTKLVYFTFENGVTQRYALTWIFTQVEFVLHERFI